MATKKCEINLSKEIIAVMSMFNGRYGTIDHKLSEIESELSNRHVSYNGYELEVAIVELIKRERIVIHTCRLSENQEKNSSEYTVSLRTLC